MLIGGTAIMVASVLMGNAIREDLAGLGVDAYTGRNGLVGWLKFMFFAFGFPLGLAVGAIGGLLGTGEVPTSPLRHCTFLICVVTMSLLVPFIFGREPSSTFFGVGGYAILGLIVAAVWLWGNYRAQLPHGKRTAVDLHGAGYLCFAMGAWNLCGIGGMPSFALDPEKMLALGSRGFAIGQMKAVMVLLLLGWLFTVLGYRKALQSN